MNRRIRKKKAKRLFGYAAEAMAGAVALRAVAIRQRTLTHPVMQSLAAKCDADATRAEANALTTLAKAMALTTRKRPYQRVTLDEMKHVFAARGEQPFSITFE
jgi:hypothetical protein